MGFIYILLCIFLSIIQIYYVNYLLRITNPYNSIIHFFLSYQIIFLQLIPLILNLLLLDFDKSSEYLLYAYLINGLYFLVFLFYFNRYTISHNFISNGLSNKKLFLILTAANLYNILTYLNYLQIIAIDLERLLFPFFGLLSGLSKVAPFIAMVYFYDRKFYIKFYTILSIFLYFMAISGTGMRSLLVMPIFYLIFYYQKISYVKKLLILILLTLFFIPISGFYKNLRLNSEDKGSQLVITGVSEFIEELSFRLGENNKISSGIVEMIGRDGPVGSEPLISSALSIIPSFYFEDGKPWPGSYDGTSFGILARQAHEFVYGAIWNMSEYMYTLHPFWEFGLAYFFLNIFLTILWILCIERIAWRIGDKVGLIIICSFIPFTYSVVIQPIVLIFQTMAYITIPGVFFFIIYKFFMIAVKCIKTCIK